MHDLSLYMMMMGRAAAAGGGGGASTAGQAIGLLFLLTKAS